MAKVSGRKGQGHAEGTVRNERADGSAPDAGTTLEGSRPAGDVDGRRRGARLRTAIQLLALVLVSFLALRHQWLGVEGAAPIDAYCPFGGVEGFLTLVATGQFLRRIYWASIALMVVTVAMTVVFGRAFCGTICPLGTLQEWVRKLARLAGLARDRELPPAVDRYGRYAKYAVLVLVLYLTYATGDLVFRDFDPYNAIMHFGAELEEKPYGYAILAAVLLVAVVGKNLWCRYLCPLGAFYAIVGRLKRFDIERDAASCIACGACNRRCLAGLDVQHSERVTDADCTSCLECVEGCPARCLVPRVGGRPVRDRATFVAAVAGTFVLLVLISVASGYWQAAPASNLVGAAGAVDVAGIRGSNTLSNLVTTTGVPLEVFVRELGLPPDVDASLMLKSIGSTYGLKDTDGNAIETDHFRRVVARHLNITYGGEG